MTLGSRNSWEVSSRGIGNEKDRLRQWPWIATSRFRLCGLDSVGLEKPTVADPLVAAHSRNQLRSRAGKARGRSTIAS